MTAKDAFTQREWELLERAPVIVARAVIAADMSGSIALVTEYLAMISLVKATHVHGSANELIAAVAADLTALQDAGQGIDQILGEAQAADRGSSTERDVARVKEQALAACREIAVLLAQKAAPAQADEFKQWLLAIGQRVADASQEDAIDSGARVTEKEVAMLSTLTAVLAVEPAW